MPPSTILRIDRSLPFSHNAYMEHGLRIEHQDEFSTAITTIDLSSITLERMVWSSGTFVKYSATPSDGVHCEHISLDAQILQTLLENRDCIPEVWTGVNGAFMTITFPGTTFVNDEGSRYHMQLSKHKGEWSYGYQHHDANEEAVYLCAIIRV